jgi:hypothetical protein
MSSTMRAVILFVSRSNPCALSLGTSRDSVATEIGSLAMDKRDKTYTAEPGATGAAGRSALIAQVFAMVLQLGPTTPV